MNTRLNPALEPLAVPLNRLREDPANARKHGDRNLAAITASLREFGQQKPVVALKDGTVIAGNGTLRAALALGWDTLAVAFFDSEDAARAKAYAIADNRTAELAEWDTQVLLESVKELEIEGYESESALGFTPAEVRELLADFQKDHPPVAPDENALPDLPQTAVTQPGDLWILGDHRLLCGDSTDAETVQRVLEGRLADLIYTDPPYNVAYGETKIPGHRQRKILNDKQDAQGWHAFNQALIAVMKASSKGGDVYVWGASGPDGMRQRLWLVEADFHWSATLIWKKPQLVLGPANYQRIYEPCFYGWLKKSTFRADRRQTEVWEMDRPFRSDLHPTMKPIALIQRALNNSSQPGDLVLDLFGGSGSTLLACQSLQRSCAMVELDPKYCDVIVQRFEEATGQKAKLGKTSPRTS
jgi:DNA modification methylase